MSSFTSMSSSAKAKAEIIKSAQDYCQHCPKIKTTPQILASTAVKVDKCLRKSYGDKENYRIISIGTSPAPLCEVLKLLGYDIVFLPVSGIRHYSHDKIMNSKESNVDTIREYLKQNCKQDDNKINILLDYTHYERTLDFVYNLFKDNLDIPFKYIHKLRIQDLFKTAST